MSSDEGFFIPPLSQAKERGLLIETEHGRVFTEDKYLNRVVYFPGDVLRYYPGWQPMSGAGLFLPQFRTLPDKGFIRQSVLTVMQTNVRTSTLNMQHPNRLDEWYRAVDGFGGNNDIEVFQPVYPVDEIHRVCEQIDPCGFGAWEVPELTGASVSEVAAYQAELFPNLQLGQGPVRLTEIERVLRQHKRNDLTKRLLGICKEYKAREKVVLAYRKANQSKPVKVSKRLREKWQREREEVYARWQQAEPYVSPGLKRLMEALDKDENT